MRHARRKRQVALAAATVAVAVLAPRICRAEASDAVRITAEAGGGLVAGGLGAVAGAVVAAAVCDEPNLGCLGPAFFGAAIGATAGIGLGTWVGGNIADGNGSIGYTYLGELGGVLTLVLLGGISAALDVEPPPVVTALFVIGLPVGGAILGYELSHDDDEETGSSSAPLVVTVPFVF